MAGPDRWNHPGWRLELPPPRHARVADYRIALWSDDPYCPVDADVRTLLEKAAGRLAEEGAVVDADARPGFTLERVALRFSQLLNAALAGGYGAAELDRFAADMSDTPVGIVRRQTSMRHRDWLSANESRLQMRRAWERFFDPDEGGFDALLCPVMPCTAVAHDHSEPQAGRTLRFGGAERPYMEAIRWSAPAGACWMPASVVPVGRGDDGLPVGIQIIAPYLGDRTALDLAGHLSALLGPLPHPDGF
jgi:amidase